MATVPGILLLGDDQIMGGPGSGPGALAIQADGTGIGQSALFEFRDGEGIMRTVPSDDATGIETSSTLGWSPWWDPFSDPTIRAWATVSSTNNTVTLTTTGETFTANQFVGRRLRLLRAGFPGVGIQDRRTIIASTATASGQTTLTVDSNWSANPITTQLVVFGRGAWTEYSPMGGYVHPLEFGLPGAPFPRAYAVRGGSAETASVAGVGVGPDAGLMHRFWREVFTAAPYFQFAKLHSSETIKTGYESGGAAATALAAEVALMASAWSLQSFTDTLEWQWVILDASQADVRSWISTPANAGTYAVDLLSAIGAIRTAIGNANAKILLVNHDEQINAADNPQGTVVANRAHRLAAAADANVLTVDMEGLRTQIYESDQWLEGSNRHYYARSEYWGGYADRVVERMELALAGSASVQSNGFPVYYLIGDSIAAGPVTETFAISNNSPTLTERARGPNQLIWNDQTGQGEEYNLGDNSLPSGTTIGGTGGPEFALMALLEERHPDGFLLIKRASVTSSLIADFQPYTSNGQSGGRWSKSVAGEHYAALLGVRNRALQWVNVTQGKQADVLGAFVVLGTNDSSTAGGGALFAGEVAQFTRDFRGDFSTRTTDTDLPVHWITPQLGTQFGIDDEAREIRAALEARALADTKFEAINIDDLERDEADNIHPTPEAQIVMADRFALSRDALALT